MRHGKQESVDQEQSFTAVVKIAGINPYVDVPKSIVNALGGGTKAAVLVKVTGMGIMKDPTSADPQKIGLTKDAERLKTIGRLSSGDWFRSTLVPLRSDATRLYLDKWMRDTAHVGVGDSVHVMLKLDRGLREVPMPAALREAMDSNATARRAWEALAPSHQREILMYLNFLKTPAALARNVQKVIADLLAKQERNI